MICGRRTMWLRLLRTRELIVERQINVPTMFLPAPYAKLPKRRISKVS